MTTKQRHFPQPQRLDDSLAINLSTYFEQLQKSKSKCPVTDKCAHTNSIHQNHWNPSSSMNIELNIYSILLSMFIHQKTSRLWFLLRSENLVVAIAAWYRESKKEFSERLCEVKFRIEHVHRWWWMVHATDNLAFMLKFFSPSADERANT